MNKYPSDPDGEALARVASLGFDMTKPLKIEFAMSAPGEEAADAIRDCLVRRGFDAWSEFDEGEPHDETNPDEVREFGPSWTVYVGVVMVPDYDDVVRIQSELDQISKPRGGYSDGWGVYSGQEYH